jgi:energy-converting hydrogenase Eha subunit B
VIFYICLLLVPLTLSLMVPKSRNPLIALLMFVLFVFLIGLREQVGADFTSYIGMHNRAYGANFENIFSAPEAASGLVVWLSANYGYGVYSTDVFSAAVLMFGVLTLCLRTQEPWLALTAVTPHLCIISGMAAVRQVIAVGIFFLVLANGKRLPLLIRLAMIGLATLFHSSALALVTFLLPGMRLNFAQKVLGGIAAAVLAAYFLNQSEFSTSLEGYSNLYLSSADKQEVSSGALWQLMSIAVPAAAYFLLRKSIHAVYPPTPVIALGAALALAFVPASFAFSNATARFAYYLQFVPLLTYPMIASIQRTEGDRLLIRVCVAGFSMAYLVLWLMFANTSFMYIPYRNIAFEP